MNNKKKLGLVVMLMAAIAMVAQLAFAVCATPTGSAGGAGWNGGLTQTYIKDVSIHPLSASVLIVNACDVGTTNCVPSNIDFGGKVRFLNINGNWHGTQAQALRRVAVRAPGCFLSAPARWCIVFQGDTDAGDHLNDLQNGAMFTMDENYGHPVVTGNIEAPFPGQTIVKIAGMGASPAQTLRVNGVNSTITGIATKDFFFTMPGCP